eukprot:GHVO01041285.1.p1 GENE.GHVO01041285.1~~GHVO01041285.1.p1  ORF type:complete len:124 (+),score=8.26 GHVO01041285.1:355-726(+)
MRPLGNATTCLTCKCTCYYGCPSESVSQWMGCIDPHGCCTVCPLKCKWNLHQNLPFESMMKKVRQDLENAREEIGCAICGESGLAMAALDPCGHVPACFECSEPLNKCPLCRSTVTKKLRLYL